MIFHGLNVPKLIADVCALYHVCLSSAVMNLLRTPTLGSANGHQHAGSSITKGSVCPWGRAAERLHIRSCSRGQQDELSLSSSLGSGEMPSTVSSCTTNHSPGVGLIKAGISSCRKHFMCIFTNVGGNELVIDYSSHVQFVLTKSVKILSHLAIFSATADIID